MIDMSFTSSYDIAHERKRRRTESLLVTASNMRHEDMRFFDDLPQSEGIVGKIKYPAMEKLDFYTLQC